MQHALFGLMVCTFLLGFRTVNEPNNSLQCRKALIYTSEAFALNGNNNKLQDRPIY
jgi:hypothetical protein